MKAPTFGLSTTPVTPTVSPLAAWIARSMLTLEVARG